MTIVMGKPLEKKLKNERYPTPKTEVPIHTKNACFYRSDFTGKERDEETGFGYFGARYMDHELTTMWLSVDPMADKYPSISPYAYCAWNPVKLVDPDGMEINPVYTREGQYLGNTKEGFTGEPLIMSTLDYETMMGVSRVEHISELNVEDVHNYRGTTFDDAIEKRFLNGDAQEKIIRNIISQYNDSDLTDKYGFSASDVADRIKYDADGKKVGTDANFATATYKTGNRPAGFYFKRGHCGYELTVENITASMVYHEWLGHEIMGYMGGRLNAREGGTHYACYLSVMISPIYKKTTPRYKEFNEKAFKVLFQ